MRYSVAGEALIHGLTMEVYQIGCLPGKFELSQVVLSALALIIHSDKRVRFVSTTENKDLNCCQLFITDIFALDFPCKPSYNEIKEVWEDFYPEIIGKVICNGDEKLIKYIFETAQEKLCDPQVFYKAMEHRNNVDSLVGLSRALRDAVDSIVNLIEDAQKNYNNIQEIQCEMQQLENGILRLPFNMDWRTVIKAYSNYKDVVFVIIPEAEGNLYCIEYFNAKVDFRTLISEEIKTSISFMGVDGAKVKTLDLANRLIDSIRENFELSE